MARSISWLVVCVLLLQVALVAAATPSRPSIEAARLDRYSTKDGSNYFALSLSPTRAVANAGARAVVVLFDTSASQAGAYRDKALGSLAALLAALSPQDRVQLLAIDIDTVPLTAGFVAPAGKEIDAAIAKLRARVPLGSTDLPLALKAAQQSAKGSQHAKAILYIGDGMSSANFLRTENFKELVAQLNKQQLPVSSYAVGPRVDAKLLAALANQTGGVLAVDNDKMDDKQAGIFMARAAQAQVMWPKNVRWPKSFAEVYPATMPPLRSDRDSIVVGKGAVGGSHKIEMTLETAAGPTAMQWSVTTGGSNEDFAYLPALVDGARADGGASLTTLGSAGLDETRRVLNAGAGNLATLGTQAASTGNLDTAEKLADEALRRDPGNPTAVAIKKHIKDLRSGKKPTKTSLKGDLRLGHISNEQAAPPPSAPAEAPEAAAEEDILGEAAAEDGDAAADEAAPEDAAPEDAAPDDAPPASPPPPAPGVPPDAPIGPAPGDPLDLAQEGAFLEAVEAQRRVVQQLIQTEVQTAIREARDRMRVDPDRVIDELKLTHERVMRAPELTADIRAQLRDQLQAALQEANRIAVVKEFNDQQEQATIAAARERLRITEALARDQEKVRQLMDRFNSLMEEGRYLLAEEAAAAEVQEVARQTRDLTYEQLAVSSFLEARTIRYTRQALETRIKRQKAVVDTLAQVEFAHIPFPDDQPVVYPDAQVWEELTQRRKKYAKVDLAEPGSAEAKILDELEKKTSFDFIEQPLNDVIETIKDQHDIEIQLDTKALEDAGIGTDTPVTRNLKGITLRSALRLMLGGMDLTYMIKNEVLMITTPEKANTEMDTRVYPVADLVIPIQQSGFAGGFGGLGGQGGQGGGGFGGQGGGGFGGGGGGFGGGGFGGGGGGGQGFFSVPDHIENRESGGFQAFAVEDDLRLGTGTPATKAQVQPQSPNKKVAKPRTAKPRASAKSDPAPAAKGRVVKGGAPKAIDLPLGKYDDPEAAWRDYFATHKDVDDADVRETVRRAMKQKQFDAVIAIIRAALVSGHPQPWMYEAMGLAMQAAGSPSPEIERTLMSALDFSESMEDLMYTAQYMARSGLETRALKIFRQVSQQDPLRPEPYMHGLRLAQRLNDQEAIQWATLGILSQAWPNRQREIMQSGLRAAAGLLEQLKAEKRSEEATQYQAQLDKALVRDVMVKVTWTGDADIDVIVEEPPGTVSSFRSPRTTSGGVMLGDTAARAGTTSADGFSEVYVCPRAFAGRYRVLLRRVWGSVTAGKATVDVYEHYGTKAMKHYRQQIPVGEQDAVVQFELKKGRRTEALAEHQVANAVVEQVQVNQAILAQQLNGLSSSQTGLDFGASRQGLLGGPFVRGAVGFQPVIITLPAGANMSATGVISADRRYVRITVLPLFSQIGQVTTFNIGSGMTTTMNTTTGGGATGIVGGGGGAAGGGALAGGALIGGT